MIELALKIINFNRLIGEASPYHFSENMRIDCVNSSYRIKVSRVKGTQGLWEFEIKDTQQGLIVRFWGQANEYDKKIVLSDGGDIYLQLPELYGDTILHLGSNGAFLMPPKKIKPIDFVINSALIQGNRFISYVVDSLEALNNEHSILRIVGNDKDLAKLNTELPR